MSKRLVAVACAVLLASACASGTAKQVAPATSGRLDPRYNPAVTQANIDATICTVGYTTKVRPPTSYTRPIKLALIAALPTSASHNPADYELDHLVPLEDGGHPKNRLNLVLEPKSEAKVKQIVEDRVNREICSGKITLAVGRRCFVVDWRQCP